MGRKKKTEDRGGKEGGRLRSLFLLLSRSKNPTQKNEGGRGEGETGSEKKTLKSRTREGGRRERRNGQEGGKEGERGLWSSRPTQVRLRLLLASASLVYRAKVEAMQCCQKEGYVAAKNSCLPLCM